MSIYAISTLPVAFSSSAILAMFAEDDTRTPSLSVPIYKPM